MRSRNDELYEALKDNGYPDDFCREIAYKLYRWTISDKKEVQP